MHLYTMHDTDSFIEFPTVTVACVFFVACTYLHGSLRLPTSQNPPQHVGLLKHLTLHADEWILCANKSQDKSV